MDMRCRDLYSNEKERASGGVNIDAASLERESRSRRTCCGDVMSNGVSAS